MQYYILYVLFEARNFKKTFLPTQEGTTLAWTWQFKNKAI